MECLMNTDTKIFDDMFDVAGALKDVNVETSKDLSALVSKIQEVRDQLADAEQEVKRLTNIKNQLETDQIPALMEEMGQTKGTWNGVEVKLVQKIDARITEANKEAAFAWLRNNGHDGIIKNDVTMSFSKGEDNLAGDVIGLLRDKGFDPVQKTSVHASTLKSFIKDGLEKGISLDLDLLGGYVRNVASIGRKA
jgi:vesicle coat complex subunit